MSNHKVTFLCYNFYSNTCNSSVNGLDLAICKKKTYFNCSNTVIIFSKLCGKSVRSWSSDQSFMVDPTMSYFLF